MDIFLTWNKGFFDSNYQLFSNGKIHGSIFFESWKNEGKGIGLNQTLSFKTEGLINATTTILDEKNEVVGIINYDTWHTKATLNMKSGEVFAWSFTNSWLSKWQITNFKDKQINYIASTSTGTIFSNTDDEIVLLAGIFIKEYYARILIFIVILCVFIPMVTSRF